MQCFDILDYKVTKWEQKHSKAESYLLPGIRLFLFFFFFHRTSEHIMLRRRKKCKIPTERNPNKNTFMCNLLDLIMCFPIGSVMPVGWINSAVEIFKMIFSMILHDDRIWILCLSVWNLGDVIVPKESQRGLFLCENILLLLLFKKY